MDVLMVTSEAVPFSKSGGLADVLGSLSPALVKAGAAVRVYMPMYSFIDAKGFKPSASFTVPMLNKEEQIETVSKTLHGVEYVGVVHPYFTERKGIYGDTSFTPYADNAPRFMLFAKSVGYYIKATRKPDVVHSHDWTAGLVSYYLKEQKIKARTVFTIHNLAYQGDFSRYDSILGGDRLAPGCLSGPAGSKRLNMLQAGLVYSDRITTVSPTYAKEIQTKKFGCGLEPILIERKRYLRGILNGMDTEDWNPAKDKNFEEHYSVRDRSGKKALKKRFLEEHGLKGEDKPLIGMISRIADQKGYPELLDGLHPALPEILDMDVNVVIVGSGDKNYENKLKALSAERDNLSVCIAFSESLSHEVEGASDFFLMPSRYEPCGLNQLYSLRYGTLPIAHRTGGLADTILDMDEYGDKGDGFLFNSLSSAEITKAVRRAVVFYSDKTKLEKAITVAMKADFSWHRSATEYLDLYEDRA